MNATVFKERVLASDFILRSLAKGLRGAARLAGLAGLSRESIRLWLRAMRSVSGVRDPESDLVTLKTLLEGFTHDQGELLGIAENRLLAGYVATPEAIAIRERFSAFDLEDRVRLRFPAPLDDDKDAQRLGDLMVLKRARPETGEKGVLQIAYTEAVLRFLALYDLAAIASNYTLVLEPSWWGYQDMTFLYLLGHDLDVWVESPSEPDEAFVRGLDCNLRPLELGFGDWVDPATFRPRSDGPREFDIVMVSSWSPVKRHDELFKALATLRAEGGRRLRVALVGYPADWTRAEIEALASTHGVRDSCEIFEAVPPATVADIVARSKMFVLLSRREGGNRAIYEALFCDTPIVVYRRHRGVNLRHLNSRTGVTFEQGGLCDSILYVLENWETFDPREWALEHTGWQRSSQRLNDRLRGAALESGQPWSEDLAPRKNEPNLRYARSDDFHRLNAEYRALARFLRPPEG